MIKFLLDSCVKEQQFAVAVQLEQFHTNIVRKSIGLRNKIWTLVCTIEAVLTKAANFNPEYFPTS